MCAALCIVCLRILVSVAMFAGPPQLSAGEIESGEVFANVSIKAAVFICFPQGPG